MLVARSGHLAGLVGGLDPVPTAVTMSAETPRVTQRGLISGTSSEDYHHSSSGSSLTESCRMVDSNCWVLLSAIKLVPGEGCAFDTEAPDIVDWFVASVTAKDE